MKIAETTLNQMIDNLATPDGFARIARLRIEAAEAGDDKMVKICDRVSDPECVGEESYALLREIAAVMLDAGSVPFELGDGVKGGKGADYDVGSVTDVDPTTGKVEVDWKLSRTKTWQHHSVLEPLF